MSPTRRFRFAPSPTGDLHLGNARTALLAWLQARQAGGVFVMRIEDLDAGRVRPEYLTSQLEDLRWLGLDWDEGPDLGGPFTPYVQSERQGLYRSAIERLREQRLLSGCICTRREIAAAASAPHGPEEEGPAYPGTCAHRTAPAKPQGGQGVAWRYRVPADAVEFRDQLQGEQRFHPALDTGDFVVQRKDGVAAYQLTVVVDDAAMGITDVLRGADLLSSTARQILLYRSLALPMPSWTHVPLLRDQHGARLAKRDRSLSLRELRLGGRDPEQVVGWLAWGCGLASSGTSLSPQALLPAFSLARIPRADTWIEVPDWLLRK